MNKKSKIIIVFIIILVIVLIGAIACYFVLKDKMTTENAAEHDAQREYYDDLQNVNGIEDIIANIEKSQD